MQKTHLNSTLPIRINSSTQLLSRERKFSNIKHVRS